MKKIFVLFLCLIFAAAVGYAAAGQPKCTIDQTTYEAGEIFRSSGKIQHAFVVKNTGTAPLHILSATPG